MASEEDQVKMEDTGNKERGEKTLPMEMRNNHKQDRFWNPRRHLDSYDESKVFVRNAHLFTMPEDVLYHLALGNKSHNLVEMFHDVKHGMGIPSLSILIHEILKLLHHAKCNVEDVVFFRLGTSGGLGLEPGTVVISEEAVDGILRSYMEVATLGQARLDGAFCDYTEDDKMAFLKRAHDRGIVNSIYKYEDTVWS
ncbi:hypothetical protein KUTeg_015590 [Tegillarca granosa]|uniref:Uridine phosphorylase 1 n=1 Tax=Tegillarca granosa TaxID=220873 RepID=A0ABQ9EQI2_TEGGR|nr:hypothetical protein KUTeg_015590 [Tegillarca granosa]